jgi:DnaJ domain
MSADARPASSSSGQLARTPLAHLLVYAHERRLTGTFEFRAPDGASATVLLHNGQPAKARLSEPPIYLGQVMIELGIIDASALDASLREMSSGPRRLHGALLVEKKVITQEQLASALRAQVLRKLAQLARLPPTAVFEFYSDWDGLVGFGGDPTPVDALAAIWAAVREHPPLEHVKAALERMMQGRLRVTKGAQLDRFGFSADERRWIDLLRVRPLHLDAFFASAEINERIARLIAYCLAITKQVELVGDEEPLSGNIPAAEPSTASQPQSPRNAVGKVTLRRERVRTGPIPVEEQSSPRVQVPDRRASPPPEAFAAALASATVNPPANGAPQANPVERVDLRRAEIASRAQIVDKQNYFEMLGVTPEATLDEVKAAYINLAKTWHPDRLPTALADMKDACQRVFARMSEAHQTLTDEEKRKRYLRLMREGGETPEQQQEIANVLGATVEFQKAEIWLRKNDLAQATQLAKHALELDPLQADYVALVAWLASLAPSAQTPEGTQACIDDLDRALKMNERCERAYFYRAMLYKKQHRDGLAFKDFKKVAELNPKNIDAQRELRLYEMRGGPPRRITPFPSQPAPPKPGLFQKFFKK